ncbi:hypothetical protein CERZMDRAFT_97126 [Cercospora zeae-maydis SCOH1-5]|uniref:Uncharacterized protein n=1 Tax=Cercospora zeae-maydis SCOH1-5 TaxID=717836 RepID=A0A6A6FGP1_9PEZI|nr:hypothetical protein CERZMDRAFT_97126 [Cercospora zeae-maydis SCOH1-5]
MNLLQGDVTSNIPLSCNVCPRRPDFSDVSHLLTHIQSKGHLSAYYKLKVKGTSDPAAQRTIDAFDEWYADYGLEELMRERMSQKDKKKAGSGSASRRSTTATNSARSTPAPPAARRATRSLREQTLLDPQLNRSRASASSRSATPLSLFDQVNFHRSLGPLQPTWGYPSYLSNSPSTIKQESVSSFDDDDDVYEPIAGRTSRRRADNSMSALSQLDEISDLGEDITNDNTKLKGIIWPGMDIFDSATPDMKRRRNQKKDARVLKALQATSEIVEPTECVYDTTGELRREREITGLPPSEDDLIEGESEPEPDEQEKRRPRRNTRHPLVKKEPNSGRVTRGRKQAAPLTTRTAKAPYFDGLDGDDDLTYRARPKQRTGVSIHRDNTGPEITFNHPSPLNYLTSGYAPVHGGASGGLYQRSQPLDNPLMPRSHNRELSLGQPYVPFRPSSNGFTNLHPQAYSTFGGLFSQQPIASNATPNADAIASASATNGHSFGAFNHNFGVAPANMPNNTNTLFQTSATGDLWDIFNGVTDPVDSIVGDAELGFGVGGEVVPNNTLFLSDVKPAVEDEEGCAHGSQNCDLALEVHDSAVPRATVPCNLQQASNVHDNLLLSAVRGSLMAIKHQTLEEEPRFDSQKMDDIHQKRAA